jgi:quinol monooxygenase YgiN
MSEPIVFISHNRIKDGKLDEFKQISRQAAEMIEESKPGTVVFLSYLNEDGTEVTFLHVYPDEESMERHMEGAGDRAKAAYEFIEPLRFEVYGQAPETILEMLKQTAGSGVALDIKLQPLAGYIRHGSG